MKLKNFILNLFTTLISISLGFVILEFFARSFGLGNPLLYREDSLVGYRLKPNQSKLRRKNSKVTTDFEGFRVDHTKKYHKNDKLLVFVGDSVTYGGSYIDDTDLFSSKICDFINNNYFCLNNGLNSWGVLNMGRFIDNFSFYSRRKPHKFILVILPGDESRNLRSFSDTPYWDSPPKQPSAINEIIKFLNSKYFIPSLKKKGIDDYKSNKIIEGQLFKLQREVIWKELEFLLKEVNYKVDIVVTPPKDWFLEPSKIKVINTYENLLKNISELKSVENTCNLYYEVRPEFNSNLYTDGVHLSKMGHALWAKKIYSCLNLKNLNLKK